MGFRDAGLPAVPATAFLAGFFAAFLAAGPAVAFFTAAFFVAVRKGGFFATTFCAVPRRAAFFTVVFPVAAFFATFAGAAFREDAFAVDFPTVVFLAGVLRIAVLFTARRDAAGSAAVVRFAPFPRAGTCFRAAVPAFLVAFLVGFFTVRLVVAILPPFPLGLDARQQ
jgi:hypothetical protein